jgi:hypothetical protein
MLLALVEVWQQVSASERGEKKGKVMGRRADDILISRRGLETISYSGQISLWEG